MEKEEKIKNEKPSTKAKLGAGLVPHRNEVSGAGLKTEEEKVEFESKLLDLARVVHVRAGGKKLRFRAVIVTGNRAGKVGVGVATGLDVAQALEKATFQSKRNMVEFPIVEDTIPHEVYAKFGAAEIILKPQRRGRGLVAGGPVRIICQLAGIKNISSKLIGPTRNKINNARATLSALKKLKYAITRIKTNS